MKLPVLEIGGEGWASRDKVLLGYIKGSEAEGLSPKPLKSERGANLAATRINKNGLVEKGRWNVLRDSNAFDRWEDYGGYGDKLPGQQGYDGTNNAWKIIKDSNVVPGLANQVNKYLLSPNTVTLANIWTFSIYAKAGSLNSVFLYTGDGGQGDGSAVFNLQDGVVHSTNATSSGGHADIENVGNGWYRCSLTSGQSTSGYRFRFKPTNFGPGPQFTSHNDGDGFIYVQNAQAESGHAASPPIVTGYKNRVTNSNQLSQTSLAWSESLSGIVKPGFEGHDGKHSAFLLQKENSWQNLQHDLANNSPGPQTLSVYAKAGKSEGMVMRADLDGGQQAEVRFQLRKGFVESYSGGQRHSQIMTDVGNGWWRCELRINGTIDRFRIYPADSENGGAGVANASESIFVQYPQLEAGLEATEYEDNLSYAGPLEDEPRVDYTNGKAQLLLENSRVNKVDYSEWLGKSTAWLTLNSGTIERGYEAPDGTMSAYKITNTSPSGFAVYTNQTGINANDTRSIWARTVSGTGDFKLLTYHENTDNTFTVTEEWQRFELTGSPFNAGFSNLYAVDFRGNTNTLDEIIVWGAQAEGSDFSTSYIPSYGTQGSRSNDDINTSNFGNFSDLDIGNSYTVLFDFDATANLDDNTVMFDLERTLNGDSAFQARWFGVNNGNPGFKVYDAIGTTYLLVAMFTAALLTSGF